MVHHAQLQQQDATPGMLPTSLVLCMVQVFRSEGSLWVPGYSCRLGKKQINFLCEGLPLPLLETTV